MWLGFWVGVVTVEVAFILVKTKKVRATANALEVWFFIWHCVRSLRSLAKPLSRWWDVDPPPNLSSLHLGGENMAKL